MMEHDAEAIMTKREMIDKLRAKFAAKLGLKTGWGKNEVLAAFDESLREVLLELLDDEMGSGIPSSSGRPI